MMAIELIEHSAMKSVFRASAVLAITTFAVGCGRRPTALVPVAGVVTYDGRPLGGALVSYYPREPNSAHPPGEGKTDQGGRYEIRTGDRWGLVPGLYRVSVTAGAKPTEAKVGDTVIFYGSEWRKVPSTGGEINLALKPAQRDDSY
jgi:hypothetical protein